MENKNISQLCFSGTPVTPGGRLTNRTPYMTGTPGGGITPGAMSAAGTPFGTTPRTGYGAINTPYTPSGQTPILTPYNTPHSGSTPRHRQSAMTPHRPSMPPPSSGGSTPMGRSGRSHQPSPMYGGQPSTSSGYGRSPAVARGSREHSDRDRGGWAEAAESWARGSRRTPRTNEGGHTPKGKLVFFIETLYHFK